MKKKCYLNSFTHNGNPQHRRMSGLNNEQVKVDLQELLIDDDLRLIKKKSKNVFKNLVKKQTLELALEKLLEMKDGYSKIVKLEYSSLDCSNI